VHVVRLDVGADVLHRDAAVRLVGDRLRLDAAQHRGAAAFVLVRVRLLADQVFVAAAAVRHQRDQIRLRTAGREHAGLEAEQVGREILQAVDGGVVAIHVVADGRGGHGGAHRFGRFGDGIAAQVDPVVVSAHGRDRDRGEVQAAVVSGSV
jgi:hypothetical protein